jgi:hypothetical protein
MDPDFVQTQREPSFRGSQISEGVYEGSPISLVFSGLRGRFNPFKCISPSGPSGREASSKIDRKVPWVEEARQEVHMLEASRSCVPSMKN